MRKAKVIHRQFEYHSYIIKKETRAKKFHNGQAVFTFSNTKNGFGISDEMITKRIKKKFDKLDKYLKDDAKKK